MICAKTPELLACLAGSRLRFGFAAVWKSLGTSVPDTAKIDHAWHQDRSRRSVTPEMMHWVTVLRDATRIRHFGSGANSLRHICES